MARARRNKKISQKILNGQCVMCMSNVSQGFNRSTRIIFVILGLSSSIPIKYFVCTGPDD